jgi:hypothetical protein
MSNNYLTIVKASNDWLRKANPCQHGISLPLGILAGLVRDWTDENPTPFREAVEARVLEQIMLREEE